MLVGAERGRLHSIPLYPVAGCRLQSLRNERRTPEADGTTFSEILWVEQFHWRNNYSISGANTLSEV